VNNPVGDARLSAQVLHDEWDSLRATADRGDAERLSFYRFCFVRGLGAELPPAQARGLVQFLELAGATQIDVIAAGAIFRRLAHAKACPSAMNEVLTRATTGEEWAGLAYCAAWLGVAGSNSVLPPWVRHQFPAIVGILKKLRDTPCAGSSCEYCNEVHDPVSQLRRYFSFEQFRPKPASPSGASLQEAIARAGLGDRPLLAILPTSGGKSLCYQLPALVRNFRRGVLTIIISPLQALMKDQVDNVVAKTGTPSAAALYGLLTPPERGEVLERTRLGDIAILYVSPEQLRNRSFI
jgi:ATP-dependent DNA helicase RecQ